MIKLIIAFLGALPELIKLVDNINKNIKRNQINSKAKDDVKIINEAFKKRDSQALRDLFNF